MRMKSPFKAMLLLMCAAMPACVVGCADDSAFAWSGKKGSFVGEESLSRIRPGETDVEWVLAVLGRPEEREPLSGGAEEIWKYQYQAVSSGGSRAYLINSRTEKGENARYIYIQLAGGIVSDWWRD
jgi:outer membrane protein assembly factor BamE (lipoprotein component of BamABCDE complex)